LSTHGHGSPGETPGRAGYTESSYREHRYAYRDDEEGFELEIDGQSLGHMTGRIGPDRYHTHILPFSEFSTPEALAETLIDLEGQAWTQVEGEGGGHDPGGHDHGGHGPDTHAKGA
jgi:hypothetical protein